MIQLGARTSIPIKAFAEANATMEAAADVQQVAQDGGNSGSLGLIFGYRQQLFFRTGYAIASGNKGGPALGIGFERKGFAVDIARRIETVSTQSGEPPTYVSLRARF